MDTDNRRYLSRTVPEFIEEDTEKVEENETLSGPIGKSQSSSDAIFVGNLPKKAVHNTVLRRHWLLSRWILFLFLLAISASACALAFYHLWEGDGGKDRSFWITVLLSVFGYWAKAPLVSKYKQPVDQQ